MSFDLIDKGLSASTETSAGLEVTGSGGGSTLTNPLPVLFSPLKLKLMNDAPLAEIHLADTMSTIRCELFDTTKQDAPGGPYVSNLFLTGATVALSLWFGFTLIATIAGTITEEFLRQMVFTVGTTAMALLAKGMYKGSVQVVFPNGSVTFERVWLRVMA